ncbi:uncharacterized protein LOC114977819 [Acropora millepora]|uniref:uncharacterized protein LOC114977819 n=1 Tax=Acropora millepora TaxID=45264 RepID=UPI001CF18D90|nr:uncharacterized protein LOC114977819 [Acropora millepora]
MGDEEYKSVLIVNDSADAHITFYLYPRWDVICWLSLESKILKPGEKYLHRSKKRFQFKIVARFQDDQRSKTILDCQQWDGDKLFKISETTSPTVTEEALTDQVEKRICLRKVQRSKELKRTRGGRNFYDILGLDMKKVRKMSKEQQAKEIRKGYLKQMHIWHPDRDGGDEEIAKEILFAYETLQNEEKRACYNNLTEYDEGWLSLRRYKAIFKPECVTEEQREAYKRRMALFAMSALLTIGGIVSTSVTAGLAAPVVVICGGVFGGGSLGAGLQSLKHTLKKESVVDGCSFKDWSGKAGIGFVAGAVTGGAGVGIYAAVTGIGSAALESAVVTTGQYIGTGVTTGAVGGMASSLAADAGRRFVEGKDVTLKQTASRALCGAVVGSVAGVVGGAVTKAVVGSQPSAAAANLEGEGGEQDAIISGAKRLGNALARKISRSVAENGAEAVVGGPLHIVEERLDDSVENQSPGKHIVNGIKNAARNFALGCAREGVAVFVNHAYNEFQGDQKFEEKNENPLIDDDAKRSGSKLFSFQNRESFLRDEENGEGLHKWSAETCSVTYRPLNIEETPDLVPENLHSLSEDIVLVELKTDGQPKDGKVKYICNGAGLSKMVVSFFENSEKVTEEVKGSGKSINIPSSARKIEVRFQVLCPFWGDICKYDRFHKSWFRPDEPHIFRYDTPPIRTFTISGNLWWKAVIRVSDKYHEETKEM